MSTPVKELVSTTLAHANRVHAVLEQHGRGDAARRLAAEAGQWKAPETTVVVAGDVKRGKSSLVNALVGRPGLLPVDADVSTAVHLSLRHGAEESITVTMADGEQRRIEPDQLAAYASVHADPATVAEVAGVDVRLPHPLLDGGLQLVDTPGVGGMQQGHRDTTMAALQRADLLVFVVSLQEPVARTELEFLAEASERIGNVLLVGARADLATADANAAMAADLTGRLRDLAVRVRAGEQVGQIGAFSGDEDGARTALANRLERIASRPVVLTSAHLAEQARVREERGRPERAVALREQSGLDTLTAALDRAAEARAALRLANLLQLAGALQAGVEDEQSTRERALAGDSRVESELAARQEQLERAASQQARWRGALGTTIARLQTQTSRGVSRELSVLRDHYRQQLDDATKVAELQEIAGQLQASVQAVWDTLSTRVVADFNQVITELLTTLEVEADEDLFGELEQPHSVTGAGPVTLTPKAEMDLVQDVVPLATQAFLFGNIANVGAMLLGVASGGLGFVAFGVGMAVSMPIVHLRRKQRSQQKATAELQREINDALFGQEGVSREFSAEMNLRILDAREQLENLIDDRLTARRKELEARRKELQQLLRSEQAARTSAQRESEQLRARLAELRQETTRLADAVDRFLADHFADLNPSPGSP